MAVKAFSGGEKLTQHLQALSAKIKKGAALEVGFMEGATYPDGTSVAMVAAIQEFGAPSKGIPPRPFFRRMISKESPHWGGDLAAILEHRDYDGYAALTELGNGIVGELQQSINDLADPPLSPVTLLLRERFGSNKVTFADVQRARADIASGRVPNVTSTQAKPLISTGHLVNSVTLKVTE